MTLMARANAGDLLSSALPMRPELHEYNYVLGLNGIDMQVAVMIYRHVCLG